MQLRSSFKQAFSKKKSPKSASSHSDIEEMTDSSLPASPKLPHNGTGASGHMLRNTHSNSMCVDLISCCCCCLPVTDGKNCLSLLKSYFLISLNCVHRLSECLDSEAETVMQLRSELREKEMKLTDIRLEALSSAHQLDQLREAMNRMQVCTHKHTHWRSSNTHISASLTADIQLVSWHLMYRAALFRPQWVFVWVFYSLCVLMNYFLRTDSSLWL